MVAKPLYQYILITRNPTKWFPTPNPPSGQGGLQMDKAPPPNPSRLANGQGLTTWGGGPPTLHDLQMDKGWAPPPPPTLHDLQVDKGWGPPNPSRLGAAGPPNPSRLANKQGLGTPTLHDLQMHKGWAPQPFTTCKWTRVGGPQPLTTWGGRAPQPFTTCKWTRVGAPPQGLGAPNPSRLGAAGPPTLQD